MQAPPRFMLCNQGSPALQEAGPASAVKAQLQHEALQEGQQRSGCLLMAEVAAAWHHRQARPRGAQPLHQPASWVHKPGAEWHSEGLPRRKKAAGKWPAGVHSAFCPASQSGKHARLGGGAACLPPPQCNPPPPPQTRASTYLLAAAGGTM